MNSCRLRECFPALFQVAIVRTREIEESASQEAQSQSEKALRFFGLEKELAEITEVGDGLAIPGAAAHSASEPLSCIQFSNSEAMSTSSLFSMNPSGRSMRRNAWSECFEVVNVLLHSLASIFSCRFRRTARVVFRPWRSAYTYLILGKNTIVAAGPP